MFSDKELEGFYQEGYDACFDGNERRECPLEDEYAIKNWKKGWDKAELEIMDEFNDDEDIFGEDDDSDEFDDEFDDYSEDSDLEAGEDSEENDGMHCDLGGEG